MPHLDVCGPVYDYKKNFYSYGLNNKKILTLYGHQFLDLIKVIFEVEKNPSMNKDFRDDCTHFI